MSTRLQPQHTLHMIGNAHMDPVWVWDWREGFGEVWSTFGSALDRLEEYPELRFTASSAAHHEWIEQHDPEMFERIRIAVAAGRWSIVGGMWIEPDCNLPSGESFCRQLLLGQGFNHRAFGRFASVGFNIDSFGHNAGLPQLLVGGRLRAYVMMRPAPHERALPGHAFRWQDASGASVLAYRIPFDYATHSAEQIPERVDALGQLAKSENTPMMLFYGVGNHGGGPTRAMIEEVGRIAAQHDAVHFSDPDAYFADLERSTGVLPVVRDELQHHAVGCYSVSAWVKRENNACEIALLDAEALETVASRLAGRPYGSAELTEAWKELLLNQFHDILAGTSSEAANRTVHSRFGYVGTVADRVTTNAIYEIAHRVDTSHAATGPVERRSSFWTGREGHGVPFLVFNPLGWNTLQSVIVARSCDVVTDSTGAEVASQAVTSGELTLFRSHSLFLAELPPLGYEVFWLRRGPSRVPDPPIPQSVLPTIESDRLRASIDLETGSICSLIDLDGDTELIGSQGIHPVAVTDSSDTWSHGLTAYDEEPSAGEFLGWEIVEHGPIRRTLRLRFRFGASLLTEDLSLTQSVPFAELRLRAEWSTPHSVLKLVMPWRLSAEVAVTAGAAYGYADRPPTGAEEPMQGWLDCYDSASDRGIGCTTDHLHGYDATGATVRLTVLRNPLAADHGGKWAVRPGEDFPYTDTGRHEATLRIHPHAGDWRAAGLVTRSVEHVRRPIVVADTYHGGELAARGGFLQVEPPDARVVRAVKQSESGEGVVVRLVEPDGKPISITLSGRLLGRSVEAALQPYEVQTLLVPDDLASPCRVVDLVECDVARGNDG
jgi:alpha-mannosidase